MKMTTSSYKRVTPQTKPIRRPSPTQRPGRGPVRRGPARRPQRRPSPRTPSPRSPSPITSPAPSPGPLNPGPVPQFPTPRPGLLPFVYRGARNFPWLRAYGFVHDAWDIWNWYRQIQKMPNPGGWEDYPGTNWSCGQITGDVNLVVLQAGSLASGTPKSLCALTFQATPVASSPSPGQGYRVSYLRNYPVGQSSRCDYRAVRSYPAGTPIRPTPQFKVGPEPFIPLLPDPFNHGVAPGGGRSKEPQQREEPKPFAPPRHLRSKPPKKGEHERKGQMQAGLGKAVAIAFAGTEAADAIDAIWEALPKHIRRGTPKSGTARKGAYIGEGTKYSTPIDKAMHIFRHYRSLDLSEAAKNLLINHFIDQIIGKMSRDGADKLRKQLKAAGWGNVI